MYIKVYKGDAPIDILYFYEEDVAIYEMNKLEQIGYICKCV